jgi:hypothetical protein
MHTDSNGNKWWKWLVGGIILVGLGVATIFTLGAAAPITGLAAAMITGAFIGATTGAVLGAVASGLTFENGQVGFNWNNAADGFMWGAVSGAITGALSGGLSQVSALHNISRGVTAGQMFARHALTAGIQITGNAIIAGSVTAVEGLIRGDFSWKNVGVAAGFGALGGAFARTPAAIGAVLGIAVSGLEKLREILISLIRSRENAAPLNFLRFA